MRQVPFHRPAIGLDEEREVIDTLRSGWITTGPKAKRFEQEFAAYVGARNALAVAHCTGALHLALFAIGIEPGDEIITTPGTFNINPARIEEALESGKHRRVRAIMPVHFAGHPCDMDRIMGIARRYGL